jgi:hypothetical protein
LLRLRINNTSYIVEPYCYGRLWTGEEALRVYVVSKVGTPSLLSGWNLIPLSDIKEVAEVNGFFDGQRPDFDPHDAAMYFIFSRVEKPFSSLKKANKLPIAGNRLSYIWQSRVN